MTTGNANLGRPIADISKAEIVGSKIKSTGSLPHRIWPVTIDGRNSPQSGYPWDKIFPLDSGDRKITVHYEGAVTGLLGTPKAFSAQREFILNAVPNVRYMTKGSYLNGKVTLWIEEYPSEKIICPAEVVSVTWLNLNVMVY